MSKVNRNIDELPLVSLIIPVYNMRRTLDKCLRSALAQSFERLEIIVADDASTDSSLAIANDMAEDHSEMRVLRTPVNTGLFASRLRGAEAARAPFVAFLDADDWLEPQAMAELYDTAVSTGADMVQMRMHRRAGMLSFYGNATPPPYSTANAVTGAGLDAIRSYIGMGSILSNACWDKLYRRDMFIKACAEPFPLKWGEDQYTNIRYLKLARSVAFTDYVGYNYRWGGAMTTYRYNMLQDFKALHRLKMQLGQDPERTRDELVRLLRYHVRQLMTELGWTPQAVSLTLQRELEDPIWAECGMSLTADQLVGREQHDIKRNPVKYLIKAILR